MYLGMTSKTSKDSRDKLVTGQGEIDVVNKFKYLGVMLDNNLTFKAHVDYLLQKNLSQTQNIGQDQNIYWGRHCSVPIQQPNRSTILI